jgi:ATP-dependent Lhr-like helicase
MRAIDDAGRWTLLPRHPIGSDGEPELVEHVARVLLRRYGVVCWRLMEREPSWLPCWRELLRVYHRLEARGEIRGGRFLDGVSGEQFALPEAIAPLRAARKAPPDAAALPLSALDPANLLGTVLPGVKPPRLAGRQLWLRDGLISEEPDAHPASADASAADRLRTGTGAGSPAPTPPRTAGSAAGPRAGSR